MDNVLVQLNNFVNTLSAINPAWYVVVVGPLAYVAQRALKAEQGFVKAHGTISAVLLAVVPAAFLAVLQANSVQAFLLHTGTVAPAIFTVANLIFQHVRAEVQASGEAPAVLNGAPAAPINEAPAGV